METVRYPILLLDADGTLYDFKTSQAHALERAYRGAGFGDILPYSCEILEQYSRVNQSWWQRLERGECTKEELQLGRFREFFAALGLSFNPAEFNRMYMEELGNGTYLLPHAEEVCRELAKTCSLYIVTNGVSRTQRRRIGGSALNGLFREIFVSEDAGVPKPEAGYFEYVFSHLGEVDRKNILLVGDSLSSDMKGAENAGLDSCWFNPQSAPLPEHPHITFTIRDLRELPTIVKTGKQEEKNF